jgi:hypothetical protein
MEAWRVGSLARHFRRAARSYGLLRCTARGQLRRTTDQARRSLDRHRVSATRRRVCRYVGPGKAWLPEGKSSTATSHLHPAVNGHRVWLICSHPGMLVRQAAQVSTTATWWPGSDSWLMPSKAPSSAGHIQSSRVTQRCADQSGPERRSPTHTRTQPADGCRCETAAQGGFRTSGVLAAMSSGRRPASLGSSRRSDPMSGHDRSTRAPEKAGESPNLKPSDAVAAMAGRPGGKNRLLGAQEGAAHATGLVRGRLSSTQPTGLPAGSRPSRRRGASSPPLRTPGSKPAATCPR